MPNRIAFYAGSLPHFCNWIAPLWLALPEEYRGNFHARGRAVEQAWKWGIRPVHGIPKKGLVCVASYEDYRAVKPADVILVNHGAGQTYNGDPESTKAVHHSSYSGGKNRERVVGYLCPSERDAVVCGDNSYAIGVPYLDRFHQGERDYDALFVHKDVRPVVAFSFHADIHLCPESRWAYPHYADAIEALIRSNPPYTIIGHCHPRMFRFWQITWKKLGVEFVPDWLDVLNRADCYVSDNSSTIPEFASTGRPVVLLDAEWYRDHIHHGGRFWDWADIGVRTAIPEYLSDAIDLALDDAPEIRDRREELVNLVYDGVPMDGQATKRGVEALIEIAES